MEDVADRSKVPWYTRVWWRFKWKYEAVQYWWRQKRQTAVTEFVASLHEQHKPEVHQELLSQIKFKKPGPIAESPELQDMLNDWKPKSYIAHFAESGFSDRELAIEAYALAPPLCRDQFDHTIRQLDSLITSVQEELNTLASDADPDRISTALKASVQEIRRLVDIASAVTNGIETTSRQDEIDQMFDA